MNILILTKTFPTTEKNWGGIFVKEQADVLAGSHTVTVVHFSNDTEKFNPFFNSEVQEEKLPQYRLFTVTVSRSLPVYNQFNYILSLRKALKKIIEATHPDIIHCHYSYPAGVVARLIMRSTGIPYVITEHTRIKITFRSVFHKWLSKNALHKSCANIAVSNALRGELADEGISNAEVVPNVVDTEKFRVNRDLSGPLRIGFMGALNTDNKGLDLLLKACSGLPVEFTLKIGGSGTYYEQYREMADSLGISGKCRFEGEISREKIHEFYSDLNLFILPSRYETFGIVLVEAMASGVPVISTRCGGPEDIVSEKCGLLVDKENPDQIREAILKIYSDIKRFDPAEIHTLARNNWGREAFINKINSIYERCLQK